MAIKREGEAINYLAQLIVDDNELGAYIDKATREQLDGIEHWSGEEDDMYYPVRTNILNRVIALTMAEMFVPGTE